MLLLFRFDSRLFININTFKVVKQIMETNTYNNKKTQKNRKEMNNNNKSFHTRGVFFPLSHRQLQLLSSVISLTCETKYSILLHNNMVASIFFGLSRFLICRDNSSDRGSKHICQLTQRRPDFTSCSMNNVIL